MEIKNITSRMVLDSRGNPTIEVDGILAYNTIGRAMLVSANKINDIKAIKAPTMKISP